MGIFELTKSRISHWLNRLRSLDSLDNKIEKVIDEFEAQLNVVEEGGHFDTNAQSNSDIFKETNLNPNRGDGNLFENSRPCGRFSLPAPICSNLKNFVRSRGRGISSSSQNNFCSIKSKLVNPQIDQINRSELNQNNVIDQNFDNSNSISDVDELFTD